MSTTEQIEQPPTPAIPDLKYWCKGEPSECGRRVAALLADWAGGAHHLETNQMKKADWTHSRYVVIKADIYMIGGGLATFDYSNLTRLVFLAHDRCIRIDIAPLNPQFIKITFFPRVRDGCDQERHPTIEQALDTWRKTHPAEK